MWQFYGVYIRPAEHTTREVQTGLLIDCVLKAAGCKKTKPADFVINWEKTGRETYEKTHEKEKPPTPKKQKAFMSAIKGLRNYKK